MSEPAAGDRTSPPDKGGVGGFLPYARRLTEKARANRNNATPAEKKLWCELLRGRQLYGLRFTRQRPLGRYIVDFYCSQLMLAIEIDGDSHARQGGYDARRTAVLGRMGVSVVRYTNRDVLDDFEGVAEDLRSRVASRAKTP